MKTKYCYKCKSKKPIVEFARNNAKKDGYSSECKNCHKIYDLRFKKTEKFKIIQKKYKQSSKGKISAKKSYNMQGIKFPNKRTARNVVNYHIRVGNIESPKKQICKICGDQAEEYHHHLGYAHEHRLDIIPICRKCHKVIHNESSNETFTKTG